MHQVRLTILIETVTAMLWWGMLQAGLAIIAASLPTVYALRKYVGCSSYSTLRVKIQGSFAWLSSSSIKNGSAAKEDQLVDGKVGNPAVAASSQSDVELAPVYFSDNGELLPNESI
jgi:hypothetical protein